MTAQSHLVDAGPGAPGIERELETHRRALTGYCYRMLGSGSEAEDAVQETFLRAWRKHDGFEGRSSLKSWIYRIATNVCLDMLDGSQRRARPMDFNEPTTASAVLDAGLPETSWVMPIADAKVLPEDDPAERAAARETLRLAFVAALQHLPPRQRAVLILRDVLHWRAAEAADLLDTTTVSVNSALQRARATLADLDLDADDPIDVGDDEARALLARYVDCFERYDIDELVSLLREDATFCMPPFELWLRGPQEAKAWMLGQGAGCEGSRLLVTSANGCPAVATYRPAGPGVHEPFALIVVEPDGDRIKALHHFLYPELFAAFGLPMRLER